MFELIAQVVGAAVVFLAGVVAERYFTLSTKLQALWAKRRG